jgi:hypothetical protein
MIGNGYGAVGSQRAGGSSLPFTGLDLLLYGVIAVAIIAAGLALRAVARRKDR